MRFLKRKIQKRHFLHIVKKGGPGDPGGQGGSVDLIIRLVEVIRLVRGVSVSLN